MRRQPIKHDYNKVAMAGFIIAFAVAILAFYYVFQATVGQSVAGQRAMACIQAKIPMSECQGANIVLGEAGNQQCCCLKTTLQKETEDSKKYTENSVSTTFNGNIFAGKEYPELASFSTPEEKCKEYCRTKQPQSVRTTTTYLGVGDCAFIHTERYDRT
jgi:hypothetical protein